MGIYEQFQNSDIGYAGKQATTDYLEDKDVSVSGPDPSYAGPELAATILVTLIIILLVFLAAICLWNQRKNKAPPVQESRHCEGQLCDGDESSL